MDISDPQHSSSAAAKARTFASLIELKHEHLIRTGKPRRPSREGGGLRAQRRGLSPEDFETLGVLGRGAFAEVTLAKKRDSGAVYAIKRMRKADLVSRGHVERAWTEWMVQSEADGNAWLVKLCAQRAALNRPPHPTPPTARSHPTATTRPLALALTVGLDPRLWTDAQALLLPDAGARLPGDGLRAWRRHDGPLHAPRHPPRGRGALLCRPDCPSHRVAPPPRLRA